MALKEMLEEKYSTKMEQLENGFAVTGLLAIVYEPSKEAVDNRVQILKDLASGTWANRKFYKTLQDSWIEKQPEAERAYLEIQKALAQTIKREPTPEVYEADLYDGLHYVVLNDFFAEACCL